MSIERRLAEFFFPLVRNALAQLRHAGINDSVPVIPSRWSLSHDIDSQGEIRGIRLLFSSQYTIGLVESVFISTDNGQPDVTSVVEGMVNFELSMLRAQLASIDPFDVKTLVEIKNLVDIAKVIDS